MTRSPQPSFSRRFAFLSCAFLALASIANGQTKLAPELRNDIDNIAQQVLTKTGVPSASVAVVKNGEVVYLHAYGSARLEPRLPARPEMRYSVGSISKQFTATAILMLAEE